jgi:lipopolysaccharide/colanic/teichoic acid biosynthesis glycosyltransferase
MQRLVDAIVAAVALVIALPLLAAIALLIRLDSGPPLLFTQTRAGLNGRPFELLKFRTIEPGPVTDDVTPEGDARITRVGRVLRRYRLDELPQLVNVVKGDLALVGPRPELSADLECLEPSLRARYLALKPGLTGPVQLDFIAEDRVLADSADPTRTYRELLVPAKVAANLRTFEHATLAARLACLLRTPWVLLSPAARRRSETVVAAHLKRSSPV